MVPNKTTEHPSGGPTRPQEVTRCHPWRTGRHPVHSLAPNKNLQCAPVEVPLGPRNVTGALLGAQRDNRAPQWRSHTAPGRHPVHPRGDPTRPRETRGAILGTQQDNRAPQRKSHLAQEDTRCTPCRPTRHLRAAQWGSQPAPGRHQVHSLAPDKVTEHPSGRRTQPAQEDTSAHPRGGPTQPQEYTRCHPWRPTRQQCTPVDVPPSPRKTPGAILQAQTHLLVRQLICLSLGQQTRQGHKMRGVRVCALQRRRDEGKYKDGVRVCRKMR